MKTCTIIEMKSLLNDSMQQNKIHRQCWHLRKKNMEQMQAGNVYGQRNNEEDMLVPNAEFRELQEAKQTDNLSLRG